MSRTADALSKSLTRLMAAGLVVTGLFMLVLFGAGFLVIGRAVAMFFVGFFKTHGAGSDPAAHVLVGVLQGLEYLFVAPLAFLLFKTLINYVISFNTGGQSAGADREMRSIKILMTSLMISAVAIDLVSKVLGVSPLPLAAVTPGLLVIVGLVGYLLVLQRPH